ncbi:MAG TPA: tRNA (adenosine(37)-N6)-threonylcarbamoyltransferase complex dimerization subunit type 1 TsaB [Chryseosolibacter sp.]|nr:tRNA (adenosine(37)-N6)-threonylcarbamoyltransferase complex dimerization subunit type 1 TsaB [Chryseosolibacter sp.]
MALILSLETSTDVCSVALHDNGDLLKELSLHEPKAHAARLAPLIDELLRSQQTKISKLQAVAVSSGPGSYTGLRIGTSTAKGICFALNIPLIAVPTLELLAFSVKSANLSDLLCPMIDARRMEVYCAVYDNRLELIRPVQALEVDESSFSELLNDKRVLFFGNGAAKSVAALNSPNAVLVENITPSASKLGIVATQKFKDRKFEDLVDFAPFYLKEFEAKKAKSLF